MSNVFVYVIIDSECGHPIYVGSTVNIPSRLSQHKSTRGKKGLNCEVLEVVTQITRREAEEYWINSFFFMGAELENKSRECQPAVSSMMSFPGLREARISKGLTIENLAWKAKTSLTTAHNVQNGKLCTTRIVKQLAKAVGVKLKDIRETANV